MAEIRKDVLLTTKEAAAYLALKEKTLHNWRQTGIVRLSHLKMGGAIRYRLEDLEAFKERSLVVGGSADA